MLEQALLYPRQSVELSVEYQNIMSVNVPRYSFQTKNNDPSEIYPYGFAQTSGELDDALEQLAEVFEDMLKLAEVEKTMQLMAEEIENVRDYLNLAKARYEENLDFTIDVPENLNTITVPKLTLQPLVENAMTHGFNGMNVQRRLSVSGKVKGTYLVLEIRDNGTGFPEEMLENLRARIKEIEAGNVSIEESAGHIGLVNTCLRLYYYSHGQMHVAIRNDNGAVITLVMPFGEKENPA